ncbi:MAG: hypothetical protein KKA61_00155 [Nanoarchaeota archaeon]|nr:hypothetical protein [Nanoarchaeota archaeon]MBU4283634.1 hypothetical protein [Nanoarchaeota archaeon]MBU4492762.1 hypothetical protein [Nanoarchaeota archaeon]
MKFSLNKQKIGVANYKKEDFDIAYEFSKKLYKEMKDFVKATVLFGSSARKTSSQGDIDVLVIIDDLTVRLTPELTEAYTLITEKIITETSNLLHITTLKLTAFWEYVRSGDPVIVNMLREGIALLDTGFFEPIQFLLKQGRIRPTHESVWSYFAKAPSTLYNSKWHLLQATIDLYWAVIDAAHSALMKLGEIPPSPEHVADMMQMHMVNKGLIDKKYADTMKKFYMLSKKINHREIKEISGKEYDSYYKEAQDFVYKIREFIEEK